MLNNFMTNNIFVGVTSRLVPNSACANLVPAYQQVRNVRFSENLVCFVFLLPPFLDCSFCLIVKELSKSIMEPFGEMLTARNVNKPLLFLNLKEYFPLKTINFVFSEGISNKI